jgi:hypothetical protein
MVVLGIVLQRAQELAVAASTFLTQYCLIVLVIRLVEANYAMILIFQGQKQFLRRLALRLIVILLFFLMFDVPILVIDC